MCWFFIKTCADLTILLLLCSRRLFLCVRVCVWLLHKQSCCCTIAETQADDDSTHTHTHTVVIDVSVHQPVCFLLFHSKTHRQPTSLCHLHPHTNLSAVSYLNSPLSFSVALSLSLSLSSVSLCSSTRPHPHFYFPPLSWLIDVLCVHI